MKRQAGWSAFSSLVENPYPCHSEERSDVGIRNPNAANSHKSGNFAFWRRIATPVCGLARNDRLSPNI